MTDLSSLEAEFERLLQERKRTPNERSTAKKATKARGADDGGAPGSVKAGRSGTGNGSDRVVQPPAPEKVAHDGPQTPTAALLHQRENDHGKGTRPPPFEANARTLADHPRRHEPGALRTGESVWYRDQRYFIASAPADWHDTSYVRICDAPVRPGSFIHDQSVIFSVHADMLDIAPVRKSIFHDQPTKQRIETEAKKRELGITDIGDDVGELLRGKSVDETYTIASKHLRVPEDELRAKYAHLNPGQQRMVLGNRLRKRGRA